MISPEEIRRLGSSRWHAPVMAQIAECDGARHIELLNQLGLSRSALGRSLDELAQFGWVVRNPGHGHPLRPEYIATAAGRPIGIWCQRIVAERQRLRLPPGALGRWSLPVIAQLGREWTRFSVLESNLAPISARALSLSLKQMIGVDLVARRLEDRFPPTALYGLTARGQRLGAAIVP